MQLGQESTCLAITTRNLRNVYEIVSVVYVGLNSAFLNSFSHLQTLLLTNTETYVDHLDRQGKDTNSKKQFVCLEYVKKYQFIRLIWQMLVISCYFLSPTYTDR
jgi:hypothetical protein